MVYFTPKNKWEVNKSERIIIISKNQKIEKVENKMKYK